MTTITDPTAIDRHRLVTLRSGIKLEQKGMTRRGRSCTSIAKQELGLSIGTARATVLGALERRIAELDKELANARR